MGRHVAGELPELDRLVDDACAEIGREIEALRVPCLAGVVLAGGYGRGEGGARAFGDGMPKLSNDLDFFAIAGKGSSDSDAAAIAAALEPVSRRWTEKLGIDVDFTARTPWRLKHDEERIMVQELLRGYCDVAGAKGEELFAGIERRPAEAIPWMEAARLLMNRGMGLLLAKLKVESLKFKVDGLSDVECRTSPACRPSPDARRADAGFVARNINKCILGAGDAFLVSRGLYRWRAEDRAAELKAQGGDGLYARAVEWKFRPREEPVCDWETARGAWLDGYGKVVAAADGCGSRRTLRNAARWLVRRRSVGDLRTFALDPVVRVLAEVERHVRTGTAPGDSLMRDWKVFN